MPLFEELIGHLLIWSVSNCLKLNYPFVRDGLLSTTISHLHFSMNVLPPPFICYPIISLVGGLGVEEENSMTLKDRCYKKGIDLGRYVCCGGTLSI